MGLETLHDDNVSSQYGDIGVFYHSNLRYGDQCSTRKIVAWQCRTQEVELSKFIRKCEKTEQIFKDCVGRPSKVVRLNKEYTEEDVTEQVVKRSFIGGIGRFFEAAKEIKKGSDNVFGDPHYYNGDSSSSARKTHRSPSSSSKRIFSKK